MFLKINKKSGVQNPPKKRGGNRKAL